MKKSENGNSRPWVVLVTGLNGIRKTTTVSQTWFKNALLQSLMTSKQQDINLTDSTKSVNYGTRSE